MDWSFEKFWELYNEDVWLYCKLDPDQKIQKPTKIVTCYMWFEKNSSVDEIYKIMEILVKDYIDKWHMEHPEPSIESDQEFTEDDIPESAKENMQKFSYRVEEAKRKQIEISQKIGPGGKA